MRDLGVDAFYESIHPLVPKVHRLACRLAGSANGDDVVQEAVSKAWQKRRQFDPERGSLSAWLMAITANEARRVARRAGRSFAAPPRAEHGAALRSEETLDLGMALTKLSARQRLAIDCFYFAGLSTMETAAVMGCSEGTVKSTMADARRRLKQLLEGETNED